MITSLTIILLILSVGLISNSAFADHPNSVNLTFDKESYDFGDTIFITAQAISPWESTEGRDTRISVNFKNLDNGVTYNYHVYSTINDETGIAHLEFLIISENFKTGTITTTASIRIAELIDWPTGGKRVMSSSHPDPQIYNLNLNTDLISGTIQNLKNVKALDATTKDNTTNINSQKLDFDNFKKTFDEMNGLLIALNNTVTIQTGIINAQEKSLDVLRKIYNIDRPESLGDKSPKAKPNNVIQLTNIKATSQGDGTVLVTWNMNSTEPINQYRFKYAPVDEKMTVFNIYDGSLTSFTFQNLSSEEHKFKVVAFSDNFRKTSKIVNAIP